MCKVIILNNKEVELPIDVVFNNGKHGKLLEASTAWCPFKLIEVNGKQLYPSNSNGDWAIKEYIY
jgi:hypothetical protein